MVLRRLLAMCLLLLASDAASAQHAPARAARASEKIVVDGVLEDAVHHDLFGRTNGVRWRVLRARGNRRQQQEAHGKQAPEHHRPLA